MTAPGCLLQTGAVFCEKIVDAFGSRKEYTYDIRLRISPEYKRKESKEDINLSETAGKRIEDAPLLYLADIIFVLYR